MLAGHRVVMRRGSTPTLLPLFPPGSRKWEASSQAKEGAALVSFCRCDKMPAMEDLKGKGLFRLLVSKGLVYGELAPLLLGLHEAEGQGREQYAKAYLEADRRQIEQDETRDKKNLLRLAFGPTSSHLIPLPHAFSHDPEPLSGLVVREMSAHMVQYPLCGTTSCGPNF